MTAHPAADCEFDYRLTVSFSPPEYRSPVIFALAKLSTVAIRPPGVSQYSAVSPVTLISTVFGSSGPCGSQASTTAFHNSRAFAGSVRTEAVPFNDTHVSPEPSV